MAHVQQSDALEKRADRSAKMHPTADQPLAVEPQTAAQGVRQLQQTVGNRAVQRALAAPSVAPAVIQRHLTPAATNALTSLNISLGLLTGNAMGASAQVQQLGQDAAIAMTKVFVVEAGSNPPIPGEASGGAGAQEEIPVPATAGM